jgi:hypothetical protein
MFGLGRRAKDFIFEIISPGPHPLTDYPENQHQVPVNES